MKHRDTSLQLPTGGDAQRMFSAALDNGIGIAPGPFSLAIEATATIGI